MRLAIRWALMALCAGILWWDYPYLKPMALRLRDRLPLSVGPQPEPLPPLTEYALQQALLCGATRTGSLDLLTRQAARIAQERLQTRADQEAYLLLVCKESGYQRARISPKGAIGLAQVMPAYVTGFAQECGLTGIEPLTVMDSEVNLTLGACHFRKLLDKWHGNVGLALAEYNGGARAANALAKGGTSNQETDGYLAKWLVQREAH